MQCRNDVSSRHRAMSADVDDAKQTQLRKCSVKDPDEYNRPDLCDGECHRHEEDARPPDADTWPDRRTAAPAQTDQDPQNTIGDDVGLYGGHAYAPPEDPHECKWLDLSEGECRRHGEDAKSSGSGAGPDGRRAAPLPQPTNSMCDDAGLHEGHAETHACPQTPSALDPGEEESNDKSVWSDVNWRMPCKVVCGQVCIAGLTYICGALAWCN